MPKGIERGPSATFPEKRNFVDQRGQARDTKTAVRPEY
jgi:hypothetical protein